MTALTSGVQRMPGFRFCSMLNVSGPAPLTPVVSLRGRMLSPDAKQKIQDHIAAMPESLRRDPATEQELREFEASYGPIPEDYRWFLLTCGGGHFGAEEV